MTSSVTGINSTKHLRAAAVASLPSEENRRIARSQPSSESSSRTSLMLDLSGTRPSETRQRSRCLRGFAPSPSSPLRTQKEWRDFSGLTKGMPPEDLTQTPLFSGNRDRKSTRLNSSHANISYAVFCLKKKKQT